MIPSTRPSFSVYSIGPDAGSTEPRAISSKSGPPASASLESAGSAGDQRQRLTCRARCVAVYLQSGLACVFPASLKFLGSVVSGAEIHFIGRLTTKRRMRQPCVVLIDVECDQFLEPAEALKRVQVQPLVFERLPPSFNERVGPRDVGQGEKPSKESRIDQFVDGAVEVLDSAAVELTASNVGFLPAKSFAARRRISAVASGSNVADTFQASIRREKLSMTARRYPRLPSSNRISVVSTCQISLGREARMPTFGPHG